MVNKYSILIIALVLLCASVFAASVSLPTITPSYTADKNYMVFPIDINAITTGTILDFNSTSKCWYGVSNYDVNFAGTWVSDFNTCTITGYTSAGTNDFNFRIKVQDANADRNFTSPVAYYWLDETPPVTVGTSNGLGGVVLTATDSATTTGNGSGLKKIWYNLDSGGWLNTSTNPLSLTVTGVGNHTILFYSTDNLDNNEWVGNGDYWTKPFTVESVSGCGLFVWFVPILLLMMTFFVLMRLLSGKFDSTTVAMCVGIIIGMYIVLSFGASVCII
jgi:hypothetical protein